MVADYDGGKGFAGWTGRVLGYQGGDMHFAPAANAQAGGSIVLNAEGTKIVGVFRAKTAGGDGIATGITALQNQAASALAATKPAMGATNTLEKKEDKNVACGPNGCCPNSCGPNGCCPNGCERGGCDAPPAETPKYRLLPYRQQQESQQFKQAAGANPYPTLPSTTPSPLPPPDLSPIRQQLDHIGVILEDIHREAENRPAPQTIGPPASQPAVPDPAAIQALNAAQQAADLSAATKKRVDDLESAAGAIKNNEEKIAGEMKTLAENHGKLAEMVAKHGTLAERFEARKAEVDAKLGEHASKFEKVNEFTRSLVEDKIAALKDGHGDTRLIILIVVLALVAVFAVGVVKDVMNHNKTGDPLAIEKIAAQLAGQATGQPWLAPAANLASHAAHDVTSLVDQIDHRIQAHKQADATAKVNPS
jgi:hypothetical protein